MKKIFIFLLTLCAVSSLNCMDTNQETNSPSTHQSQYSYQETTMLSTLKSVLGERITNQIDKIEKWPEWAKQTLGGIACSSYLAAFLVIGSYI